MSIKNFVVKLWTNIKLLFGNFPASVKSAVYLGVVITENIKLFVDSPMADICTAIIPGQTDDRLKDLLRTALPKIVTSLKLIDNSIVATTPQQALKIAVLNLQTLDNNIKNAFLHTIAVMVSEIASDGKLSWSDGIYLVEWYYQQQFKAKK
ncbi:hypothetical protein [Mucilaginibacter sp.]|uniref:hypothetical protein n=1 Tax=Mucilaginibacter sp. TaxID=1882438 RepID=UPI0035BC76C0